MRHFTARRAAAHHLAARARCAGRHRNGRGQLGAEGDRADARRGIPDRGSRQQATVECAAGERATGGGYGSGKTVGMSMPWPTASTPPGWTVSWAGGGARHLTDPVQIYVVCVK